MAVNLKGRKTSLSDEASIYAKRSENLSEKEKLEQMTGKEKWNYFAAYYLPKIAIIAVVILIAGYIYGEPWERHFQGGFFLLLLFYRLCRCCRSGR